MSLRAFANSFTQSVNKNVKDGDVYVSTGATTGYGGVRSPGFTHYADQVLQVQAAGSGALRHADALNIQGIMRQVYFNGNLRGVERLAGAGGDMLGFHGAYWLVEAVLETWDADGWCRVLVTQQTKPPENVTEAPPP